MARLPDQILTAIFSLQRHLLEGINETAATELAIFEQFGETEITIPALEQLQNARQRLTDPYSRLCTLLLRVAESQPTTPTAMLNLLVQTIEQAQAAVDASEASIREAKRDFDLL
ncbi:hypothetical protein [Chroococcidiopsis sp. CCMEE 29]|uniref:hypothetical protein n=1 Tax=Chroococcidiopsis sp. CCMEE 29 TaxID=155894 RepID=UPI00202237E7|nr:hypothetical protein [Chroococcidiopsis sp. CCMEE 29]